MTDLIRHALLGLLILWIAASVGALVLGLGFAGSVENMLMESAGVWAFIAGPWLILGLWYAKVRLARQ